MTASVGSEDARPLRIAGGRILSGEGWAEGDLVIEDGTIRSMDPPGATSAIRGERVLDASGLLVAPGFIDAQINGGSGHDFTSRPGSIWEAGLRLPRWGVTSFLPTIVSAPPPVYRAAIDVLSAGPPPGYRGATPLGLHFEGPMLSEARRGAHQAQYLRRPALEVIDGWSRASNVRVVTLAPELPGADVVIRELTARGVAVSAGHSDASIDVAMAAFDLGVTLGTHLFNAMSGFHHRAPGLAGALLSRNGVYAGLIADGVHVHPAAVEVAWRMKAPGRLFLVSDGVAATGTAQGGSRLGDARLTVKNGAPRDPAGVLAGSVLTLDRAVRNAVGFTGCEPAQALLAASAAPARLLGEPAKGAIRPGADADIVVLRDDLTVALTIVGGGVAFDGGATPAHGATRWAGDRA